MQGKIETRPPTTPHDEWSTSGLSFRLLGVRSSPSTSASRARTIDEVLASARGALGAQTVAGHARRPPRVAREAAPRSSSRPADEELRGHERR